MRLAVDLNLVSIDPEPNYLDSTYRDTAPFKANYVHKTLVDVLVFGDKVQTKMEGKDRRIKNVRGGFGQDFRALSARGTRRRHVGQIGNYVLLQVFFTINDSYKSASHP